MLGFNRLRLPSPPHTYPHVCEYNVTNWFGRLAFRVGWGGLTLPLGFFCVILYWAAWDSDYGRLRPHEHQHVFQAERESFWLVRWLLQTIRHGYADNPYEIEATKYAAGVHPDWPKEY